MAVIGMVVWPEGEPHCAVLTFSALDRWWLAFKWSFRGKRMRSTYSFTKFDSAQAVAAYSEKAVAHGR